MSYSFNVQAKTKAEAKEAIAAEFDKVVEGQPVHQADMPSARAAADAFVDVLDAPTDGQNVKVTVNGYVSWQEEGKFLTAMVGVTASLVPSVED